MNFSDGPISLPHERHLAKKQTNRFGKWFLLTAKKAGMAVAWIYDKSDVLRLQINYKPDYRLTSVTDIEELLS